MFRNIILYVYIKLLVITLKEWRDIYLLRLGGQSSTVDSSTIIGLIKKIAFSSKQRYLNFDFLYKFYWFFYISIHYLHRLSYLNNLKISPNTNNRESAILQKKTIIVVGVAPLSESV